MDNLLYSIFLIFNFKNCNQNDKQTHINTAGFKYAFSQPASGQVSDDLRGCLDVLDRAATTAGCRP